jgi:hypothetical protein
MRRMSRGASQGATHQSNHHIAGFCADIDICRLVVVASARGSKVEGDPPMPGVKESMRRMMFAFFFEGRLYFDGMACQIRVDTVRACVIDNSKKNQLSCQKGGGLKTDPRCLCIPSLCARRGHTE